EVKSGDTVLLVVSRGPEPVEVPPLTGLTTDQADAILKDLGLVMRVSATTQPVADPGQDGIIVSQNPQVGATLVPGDIVTVTVGKFEAPPTTTTSTTTTTVPTSTTPTTTP
ncbi:MAG: PASTA domain-containing protein, partial [Acidimicrobiia bacterium]